MQPIDDINIIDRICSMLSQVTGLPPLEERICAYYCMSTHFLDVIDTFPILCVRGETGTGKTELLNLMSELCRKPVYFVGGHISVPAARDKFTEAHNGTAIVDEAETDQKNRNKLFEEQLTRRYNRKTAKGVVKIPIGPGEWIAINIEFYGPSILAKREEYEDAAMGGRSILIKTRSDNSGRRYSRVANLSVQDKVTLLGDLKEFASKMSTPIFNTDLVIPNEIAQRISNTYNPVIALAQHLHDTGFLEKLWERLGVATANLRSDQQDEVSPIVLSAYISSIVKNGILQLNTKIRLEGDLVKTAQTTFGLEGISARKISSIMRSYGFEVKKYGGPKVIIPSIITLHRACLDAGISDEIVEIAYQKYRKMVPDKTNPWIVDSNEVLGPWDTEQSEIETHSLDSKPAD